MESIRIWWNFVLVLVGASLVAFTSYATAGTSIPADTSDQNFLLGVWEGEMVTRGEDGRIYFDSLLTLQIPDGAAKGTFTAKKNGRTWETPVEIQDGKVSLVIDGAKRTFDLARGRDGKLRLLAAYESRWQQWNRTTRVSLEKR